jgi:phage N-6-adenine-methyltransferase
MSERPQRKRKAVFACESDTEPPIQKQKTTPTLVNPEYAANVRKQHQDPRSIFMKNGATNEWGTPPASFANLDRQFGPFTLDAAATKINSKCAKFFTKEDNALAQDWGKHIVWINPPYSRGHLELFIEKAYREITKQTKRVVLLVPMMSSSKWWHDVVMRQASQVFLIKGRMKFHLFANGKDQGPAEYNAAFHSAVIVFDRLVGGPPVFSSMDKECNILHCTNG